MAVVPKGPRSEVCARRFSHGNVNRATASTTSASVTDCCAQDCSTSLYGWVAGRCHAAARAALRLEADGRAQGAAGAGHGQQPQHHEHPRGDEQCLSSAAAAREASVGQRLVVVVILADATQSTLVALGAGVVRARAGELALVEPVFEDRTSRDCHTFTKKSCLLRLNMETVYFMFLFIGSPSMEICLELS